MKGKGEEIREMAVKEEERDISRLFVGIMECYTDDSVVPPLSEFSPLLGTSISKKGSSSRKRDRYPESSIKEREKREKMTQMFSVLQSMVPNLCPKASREKIVINTTEYIQSLEEERERLENLKKSPSSSSSATASPTLCHFTNRNFSINVAVTDGMGIFEILSPVRRPRLMTAIFGVFAKHNAEVLAANVAVNKQQLKLTVTATMANGGAVVIAEMIKREILLL